MRTRRNQRRVAAAVAIAAVIGVLAGGASAQEAVSSASGADGWQGLLGSRPVPQLGGRWIVVLRLRSLADRVRAAGGAAGEAPMKSWTKTARAAQKRVLARLASRGAPVQPEYEYVRVLNGFAASLDAGSLSVIARDPDVAGVYPVRAAYPAAVGPVATDAGVGRRGDVVIPGFDGTGATVALLDTGVDFDHPFVKEALLPGIDIVEPGGLAEPGESPTEAGRLERHGTELAGLVVGADGPAGLAGVAPGASLRPIRVAGWQPDATGGVSVYARTDQVLAGLEAAVDPNQDGDAHDAARIALVGVVEPFVAFADAPLSRAASGALALDTLVVAPAGNDGPAGPSYGSVGAPAAGAGALAVAATDTRRRSPTAHVLMRTGLRVLLAGEQPLGGAVDLGTRTAAPVVALQAEGVAVVGGQAGFEKLFDANGISRVAGTAPLLPPGPPTPEAVQELAGAGARAVLVDGPQPAGALGIAEPLQVPVLGLPAAIAEEVRAHLAAGRPVQLTVGPTSFHPNPGASAPAPFSSEGLAFSAGAKPELGAPGVGLATSIPGRADDGSGRFGTVSGSSAAAAVVAGAAALVLQARPDLDASALRGALVAGARPVGGASGIAAGVVDPGAAASVELVADPPTVGLGAALEDGERVGRSVRLRNVSSRPLSVEIDLEGGATSSTELASTPKEFVLGPGRAREVALAVTVPVLPSPPGGLAGVVRVRVVRGRTLRVPWAIAVPVVGKPLLTGVRLSSSELEPSDLAPAVLSLVAGRVDGRPERPQLLPLRTLSIDLYRRGRRLGRLALQRSVLPGRYAFGITGRGPRGGRLPKGVYSLQIVATPVEGPRYVVDLPFTIR
jgi:subtilisin family serine protease